MSNYIDIVESETGAIVPRVSTLEITDNGLRVMGNLPHGYTFKPVNSLQRDKLITVLKSLNYDTPEDSLRETLTSITRGIAL